MMFNDVFYNKKTIYVRKDKQIFLVGAATATK